MKLVEAVNIEGIDYPVETNCIKIIEIMEMFKTEPIEALLRFYKGVMPHEAEEGIQQFKNFVSANDWRPKPNTKKSKSIDYYYDLDLIYTAILKEYHINIFKDNVHWFELVWMMSDLRKPSLLSDVLVSRGSNIPREQVQAYSRLKKLYPLVDD